jgi:hypothetical protein
LVNGRGIDVRVHWFEMAGRDFASQLDARQLEEVAAAEKMV